jgi:putative salt-induced outer membrane protein
MTSNRQILSGIALALLAASAQAAWKGKGEAGIVFARGNTEADTVNFKLEMSEEVDRWKHALDMSALRATSGGVRSADRYLAGWQSNYKLNERAFTFGGLRYERDLFSGFDYQATASAGAGYKFFDTDKVKFSGQAGAGYRRIKDGVTGATSGNAVFVAGFDYENVLTATTKVVDKFHLESGSDNTLLSNFMGLEVKMNTTLALSVGLDVRQNTKPPAPRKKTDTISTVNLVYAF